MLTKNCWVIRVLQLLNVAFILITMSACSKAPDCSKEALDKERESKTYTLAKVCADIGNIDAMAQLGIYYEAGTRGLSQDYNRAMSLYEKAANAGDVMAMVQIANLYAGGHSYSEVPSPFKDDAKALEWYKKAAETGDSYSITRLGRIYVENKITPVNYKEAFRLFSQAAGVGNFQAMYNLGIAYLNGNGVAQDYNQASQWFKKASENWLYAESYQMFIEPNPKFIGLQIRNTTIDDIKNIFPSVHKVKPHIYGDYIFGGITIEDNKLPIQNLKKNIFLFHKDGFLEAMQFIFADNIKFKKFFELRDDFDKKYKRIKGDELDNGFKYALYEVGNSTVEIRTAPKALEVVLTLETRFFSSLHK